MNHEQILRVGESLVKYNPGWCSGFFVRRDLIATAAHCLKDRPNKFVSVHLRNGKCITGVVVKTDFDQDLGLIHVSPSAHDQTPLDLATHRLRPSTEILHAQLVEEHVKSDHGRPFNYEKGMFISTVTPWGSEGVHWSTEHLMAFVSSKGGNSGSPFVGPDGKVYGVLVAGNHFNETFAVPSNYLKQLIEEK